MLGYKKLLWIVLFLSVSLFAAEIHWEKSFEGAVAKATAAKKPMLFVLSSHNCKWCRHLERTTFQDPKVIKKLNSDFISIMVYAQERTYYPRDLYKPGTPAIWFLDSKGEALFDAIQGAIDAENFLKATEIVQNRFNKIIVKQRYGNH